jgi:hypothetical protein
VRLGRRSCALQRHRIEADWGGRIAAHDIGDVVGGGPARKPAALFRVVDQRLRDVAFAVRIEERLQLHSVAIDIPVREVGVLGLLFCAGERMNLIVEADVFAVAIAEEVG